MMCWLSSITDIIHAALSLQKVPGVQRHPIGGKKRNAHIARLDRGT